MELSALVQTFLHECEELFSILEEGFLELEAEADDPELVDGLFRAAHTLKGNAGMIGCAEFVHLTHAMENVLEQLRAKALPPAAANGVALLAAIDQLRDMASCLQSEQVWSPSPAYELAMAQLVERGDASCGAPVEARERLLQVDIRLRPDVWTSGEDPATLLEELALMGTVEEVEALLDRVPALPEFDANVCYWGFRLKLRTTSSPAAVAGFCCLSVEEEDIRISEVGGPTEVLQPSHAGTENRAASDADARSRKARSDKALGSTFRVDTNKVDSLLDLVGELVIGISQAQAGQHDSSLRAVALERLELLGREMQDQVMSLRLLPAHETFERFRRPLRDLAKQIDKPFVFKTQGGETQLDRKVLEQLVDPLKHMLRNSVAHGLESPEERARLGKPAQGTVTLSAMQREGHVVIEVSDDGRGIDPLRVRAKAESRGLVSSGQSLSEAQCYELLFLPGFSTAAEVSELSGRGVGLDVVRRNIQGLRGRIDVESRVGQGATFRIRLPLTLAIVEGMNVRVGAETVTIPLLSVVELIAPGAGTIQTVEGKHEYVDVRGELLPILRLSQVLSLPEQAHNEAEARVVLVETERRKFGLLVDGVLGMAQTVIKPLDLSYDLFQRMDPSFLRPKGVGGAAILGNGDIGIILDVHGVEASAFGAS